MLACLLHFWRYKETAAAITRALGLVLVVAAVAVPTHLGRVHRTWMGLTRLISKVTTPIFMRVVFYVVVMPIDLVMRLFGR